MARPKPVVLCILDGWGYAPPSKTNAISLAHKPTYDRLMSDFPHTLIYTSGRAVGLPEGQMGNSEVGHLNIGAGRVVYMDITRIDLMVENGELVKNQPLLDAMQAAQASGRRLHLIGLLSNGGVHSHQNHLYALLAMAKQQGLERVFVHAFLDGRDTPPDSAAGYLEQLEAKMREIGVGQIASVSGRYYAMDRDKKWERERKAFDAMVLGQAEGGTATSAVAAVKQSYARGVNDEFVVPFVCVDDSGQPRGVIGDEDVVLNFNFRADRARQITQVLTRASGITASAGSDLPEAGKLEAEIPARLLPKNLRYLCMTEYDARFKLPTVVVPERMVNILADVMAQQSLRNLRCAETEKYAHVTFFFNGGVEKPFAGEERIMVPSPKVATYDLKPEMSAAEVASSVAKQVEGGSFDVVVVNFANPDMVGHSGKIEPTVRAVEAVDAGLNEIYTTVKRRGGAMLITADHGNAEEMVDPLTGGPLTSHTTNPVPLLYVAEEATNYTLRPNGSLRDLSPTILGILGVDLPSEMTGGDLRVKKQ